MRTEVLDAPPAGVDAALGVVTGFDDVLVAGFARLGPAPVSALAALAGAVAATPLGEPAAEAVGKVTAGSVTGAHLTALAGARSALLGAVHDALLRDLDTALARTRQPWTGGPPSAGPDDLPPHNLLGAVRSWLTELAITGWRGVDQDLVSSAGQVLESVLREPGLRRLAVLLDGLAAELQSAAPIATAKRLPVRRWADLWARALVLSAGTGAVGAERISGRLLILGVDVHEHATAVQLQVHGVLEPSGGGQARLVRTGVAAAKVDTIVGPALWRLFGGYPMLLAALAGRRSLDVTDLTLLGSGDLLWADDRARPGEPADPFATARVQLTGALAPAVPPLERHPVRLGEPVLVEGYRAATAGGTVTFDLAGHPLAVDVDRLPACGPLTPALVTASSACLGLVRWDAGRWSLQPLAVQATVKRKPVVAHTGDWAEGPTDPKVAKAQAAAGDTVAVLRERAGRLLRR